MSVAVAGQNLACQRFLCFPSFRRRKGNLSGSVRFFFEHARKQTSSQSSLNITSAMMVTRTQHLSADKVSWLIDSQQILRITTCLKIQTVYNGIWFIRTDFWTEKASRSEQRFPFHLFRGGKIIKPLPGRVNLHCLFQKRVFSYSSLCTGKISSESSIFFATLRSQISQVQGRINNYKWNARHVKN